MKERTDRDLVVACLEGDRSAFPELVDRYQIQIFNAAYRITGNRADAQDVAQAAFRKVFERLDQFDPKYRFFSWIYKICVNEALNLVGKQRPSQAIDVDVADSAADPEREAQASEIGRAIQLALLELKPALRVAIVLRHFRGLSYDEISEVIGVPVKTVRSRLFAARRELRRVLDAQQLRCWRVGRPGSGPFVW